MAKHWEVVGGGDAGGILVRENKDLQSKALDYRLKTGAVIMQVELVEERVHYYLVMGVGPPEGWVSLKTKSTMLLRERDITAERWYLAIKEIRTKKKDPVAVRMIVKELMDLIAETPDLKTGLATSGCIEVGVGSMKLHPEDLELQHLLVNLLADLCLFNAYASRKAGKSGIMELLMNYFKGNKDNSMVQANLSSLGCFLDYDEENRLRMAALGGYDHCFEMCHVHPDDEEVVFAAMCAASSPQEFYKECEKAGAPETLAKVLNTFTSSDRVRSEAGMVARGLLRSDHGQQCAARFGQTKLNEAFVRATREILGSRPMQANGCCCIGFLATNTENRFTLGRLGGISVILAVIQDSTRCQGFCWGLPGMEDNLWRVLDECSFALKMLQHENRENRLAMIRAGAIDILKVAMQHNDHSPQAEEVVHLLEAFCDANPTARPQLPTSFAGQWIHNRRPTSGGIFTIEKSGDVYSVTNDHPGEEIWKDARFSVSGNVISAGAKGITGTLSGGVIRWSGVPTYAELCFYPWQPIEE